MLEEVGLWKNCNLFYNNKKINLDDLLIDIGIKNGETIELKYRKHLIMAKTVSGKIFYVNVDFDDTIGFFKRLLLKQEGIPPVQQKLLFQSIELEDSKTFKEYNIPNNSTLNLILK